MRNTNNGFEKKELGRTGLMVTPVGFGVLTVGRNQLNLPVDRGARVIRHALERGINFFDTAQYYETYPYLREALKGSREDVVLCSKCLSGEYGEMKEAVEEARRELDRDVIDLFLCHEVRHGGDWEDRAGAWEALQEAKAAGKVRAAGISTHHTDVAARAAELPECDAIFALINLESLGIRTGAGPGTREDMESALEQARRNGKGVFVMKVFGGGNLTGRYTEALDYARALPFVDSVMIGFGSIKEVDQMIDYWEGRLPKGFVPDLRHKKIRVDQGDCMGCGACVARCPNHAIFFNTDGLAQVDHSLCMTCGYCAPVCPYRAILLF